MNNLLYNTFSMKVGVYFNDKYFSDDNRLIEKICKEFSDCSCRVVVDASDLQGLEVLFVLGGDGTILGLAAECAKSGVKIIGVNYGHMGFLAEFEPEKTDEAIALVKSGKYLVQKRSMLEINCGGSTYYALNDLVVQRSTSGENFRNTVNLRAEIDGSIVDNFSSDGIIVSTPTGSTAYSLSAGGSVLTPDIEAFILTPICAHSLHSRPIVFGNKSTLLISPIDRGASLELIVDGKAVGTMSNSQNIIVNKSQFTVDFITKDDKNFFKKLLIKLNIWSK